MNLPGSLASKTRRQAATLWSATFTGRPHPKTIYFSQKVNVFGQRVGAPGGSSQKPRNNMLK